MSTARKATSQEPETKNPKGSELRKARTGHGGTGGPPGRYFRATPVPRNSSCVRLRVLDSKGEPFGSPGICLGEISGRSFRFRNRSNSCRWLQTYRGRGPNMDQGGPPVPPCPVRSFRSFGTFGFCFWLLTCRLSSCGHLGAVRPVGL